MKIIPFISVLLLFLGIGYALLGIWFLVERWPNATRMFVGGLAMSGLGIGLFKWHVRRKAGE